MNERTSNRLIGTVDVGACPGGVHAHVKDVTEIGPLPDALQLKLVYGGAVSAANANPQPALSFIKFLAEPENKRVWKDSGFDPS